MRPIPKQGLKKVTNSNSRNSKNIGNRMQGQILDFLGGGGADFQKDFENFDDLFLFLGRPN